MSRTIQAIRGMNDILPHETPSWQYVEAKLRDVMASFCYQEIRFPILEQTELFVRTIGEVTDIVNKEMYTFADRNGDSLTMRPEGTACTVRAGIQNGLLYNQTQRLWYIGPMFRHERPQKGRFRQFHQFGIEAFGFAGPDIDAEILLMGARIWQTLNIQNKVKLELNTLGTKAVRAYYRKQLTDYFTANFELLDEDSKSKVNLNPLRILDSKNPALIEVIAQAPKLLDCLDEESSQHFEGLKRILDATKLEYEINPRLVRGLDYYNMTVFEWVTTELGAQNAVCAGGHYDTLVEQLGGKTTPAIGFAIGLERLLALVDSNCVKPNSPHAYLAILGDAAIAKSLALAEELRTALPNLHLMVNCGTSNLATQLKRADKSGALLAIIIGENELNTNTATIKFLRENTDQQVVNLNELPTFLARITLK